MPPVNKVNKLIKMHYGVRQVGKSRIAEATASTALPTGADAPVRINMVVQIGDAPPLPPTEGILRHHAGVIADAMMLDGKALMPVTIEIKKTYKRYARSKTLKELRAACRAKGFALDSRNHDNSNIDSDYVSFRFEFDGARGLCVYQVWNGRAFGTAVDKDGAIFKFDLTDGRDGTPWFDQLLDFVNVEELKK